MLWVSLLHTVSKKRPESGSLATNVGLCKCHWGQVTDSQRDGVVSGNRYTVPGNSGPAFRSGGGRLLPDACRTDLEKDRRALREYRLLGGVAAYPPVELAYHVQTLPLMTYSLEGVCKIQHMSDLQHAFP